MLVSRELVRGGLRGAAAREHRLTGGRTRVRPLLAPSMPPASSTAPTAAPLVSIGAGLPYRGFTADEYHAIGAAGILHPDERTELIDGQIVPMSPVSGPHVYCVNLLAEALMERVFALPRPRPLVSVQSPLRLASRVEPEPDVAVLRPEARRRQVPTAGDALLVVEVSVSTRAYDRDVKLPLYARAGIPEVWIVVPEERIVEVYRRPGGAAYSEMQTLGPEGMLTLAALPEMAAIPAAPLFD